MLTIDAPEVLAAQILCLILIPLVLFAPLRWAVLAWLIMGNLDATGPSTEVSSSIGWINTTKGIILPMYLWWRLRGATSETVSSLPVRLWMGLTIYAATASLWSPFPLAALKLVGNMIGITLTILVLEKAARMGLLGKRTITPLILISLALGVVQTFVFGGVTFGFDGADEPTRFSSFVWAQQYAAFLVAFLTVVLWERESQRGVRTTLLCLLGAAIIMNGSRTWFFGVALVLVVYFCFSFRRTFAFVALGLSAAALGVLLAFNLSASATDPLDATSSRIVATLGALTTGQDTAHNRGLANLDFRLAIYRDVIDEVRNSDARELFFGHGTSSGGNVVLRVFPWIFKADRLDANRAIHNEWLRALYEWGVTGFVLLIAVFTTLVVGLTLRYRGPGTRARPTAILSFLPAFLLAFTTENVIASAGSAMTMSLALMVALIWVPKTIRTEAESREARVPAAHHWIERGLTNA